jgi:DNA polymerase
VSDERRAELRRIAAEALGHVMWLQEAGVRELTAAPRASTPARPEREPGPSTGSGQAGQASSRRAPTSTASPTASPTLRDKGCGSPPLLAIREELGDCRRCKLAGGRTTLVFGVGNPAAEVMFVGEGPGADEDLQGEPFVGKAGQLLTRMIEAMGYRREEVYIANVVKCRPPGNRNPEPDEIEACEPFLRRQIEAVGPRVIVALGKFAAHTLLGTSIPITKLRGQWSSYAGVRLMPTFHPAYLLRSPDEKAKAWADLQLVMAELGRKPRPR